MPRCLQWQQKHNKSTTTLGCMWPRFSSAAGRCTSQASGTAHCLSAYLLPSSPPPCPPVRSIVSMSRCMSPAVFVARVVLSPSPSAVAAVDESAAAAVTAAVTAAVGLRGAGALCKAGVSPGAPVCPDSTASTTSQRQYGQVVWRVNQGCRHLCVQHTKA